MGAAAAPHLGTAGSAAFRAAVRCRGFWRAVATCSMLSVLSPLLPQQKSIFLTPSNAHTCNLSSVSPVSA